MANFVTSHHIVVVLSLLVLIQNAKAYEFKVGGSGEWSLSASYTQWAEKNRFLVGDTLCSRLAAQTIKIIYKITVMILAMFKYDDDKDSVLEVSKEDYDNCNTGNPIAKHEDGHTVIKLQRSGPHYFISGVADHCKNNEKVLVVVMADRTHKSPPESPPSPAPSGEESPSPPSDEKPPSSSPSDASSVFMSLLCFIGAIACFLS